MISLEQIKLLEQKVEHALKKIVALQHDNEKLTSENEDLKTEVELLREQCERLEQDEEKIEQGILSVLDKLNTVEDSIRKDQDQTVQATVTEEVATEDVPTQQTPIETTSDAPVRPFNAAPNENNNDTTTHEIQDEQPHQGMLQQAQQSQLDIF